MSISALLAQVGQAASYDMMTVYASFLAVVSGLVATLVLLAVWRKALPALPISIALVSPCLGRLRGQYYVCVPFNRVIFLPEPC